MSDWRAITDDREKYKAYLCSREWALLRNAVRNRCGGKCERCKVNEMECVHHLTYARKYAERLEDLAGWCNACHEFTHGKSDFDPAAACEYDPKTHFWLTASAWGDLFGWEKMVFVLLNGFHIYRRMGGDWMNRAANGDFEAQESTEKKLRELLAKKRKEQGIT